MDNSFDKILKSNGPIMEWEPAWLPHLKEGETPIQRLEREIKDSDTLATLLIQEKKKHEDRDIAERIFLNHMRTFATSAMPFLEARADKALCRNAENTLKSIDEAIAAKSNVN